MPKTTATYSIALLLLLLTFTQCTTSRQRMLKQQYKQIYIEEFKLIYFQKLLQAGFNNSEEVNSLIRFDKSGFTEPVLTMEDYQLIERLVQADQQQMRADSVAKIGRVAEGAEGKHVFSHILTKLEGKWLDSLAKKRYKLSDFRHTSLN
ncbi:hypothetical protein [Pontibacter ramchanderi]|uniref:Uncharacterized protein n=1 Tax=Pontibacter ramchanderi TaxID=1179743 RepID=A0A2N3U9Q0_9BACT|nr:hypothetical protein [Pontibacter ramchanderi]PKV63470.1 hypothetical protein BD749_3313 [Pontibacter ramchanderi]